MIILKIIQLFLLVPIPTLYSLELSFVLNTEDAKCFTNIIFYTKNDFHGIHFPVAISAPRTQLFDNFCNPNDDSKKDKAKIRRCIIKNYHIKGIRCVKVILVNPPDKSYLSHAYWYLEKYWTRSDAQDLESIAAEQNKGRQTTAYYPSTKIEVILSRLSCKLDNWILNKSPLNSESLEYFYQQLPYILTQTNYVGNTLSVRKYVSLGRDSESFYCISDWKLQLDVNTVKEFTTHDYATLDQVAERILFRQMTLTVLYEAKVSNQTLEFFKFLSRPFNLSEVTHSANAKDFRGRMRPSGKLQVRVKLSNIQMDGSNMLVIPLGYTPLKVFTCAGMSNIVNFAEYFNPFKFWLWFTLLLFCVILCIIFRIIFYFQKIYDSIELWVVACLLEQSYNFSSSLKNASAMRLTISGILLVSIVLSNGYKGVLITSLVLPFDQRGIPSLEAALNLNFTMQVVTIPNSRNRFRIREYCCGIIGLSKGGLDHTLKGDMDYNNFANGSIHAGRAGSCRKALTFDSLNPLLHAVMDVRNAKAVWQPKNEPFDSSKLNLNYTSSTKEKIFIKMYQASNPLPCGLDLWDEMSKCNLSMVLATGPEVEDVAFQRKYRNLTYKNLYELKDPSETLSSLTYSVSILAHFGQNYLFHAGRIFIESGVYLILERAKVQSRIWERVRDHRAKAGALDDIEKPKPLDFTTRIRITFVILIGSIPFCIKIFVFEVLFIRYFKKILVQKTRLT